MLQHIFEIAIALTLSASLFGQTTAPANAGKPVSAPPVEVKRTRPQSTGDGVPKEGIPTPAQYPFGRLISELDGTSSQPPAQEAKSDGTRSSEVPHDWPMSKDVPLPQTALDALSVSQTWMTERQAPAPGKDGRVLYTFGAGLPTIVCAPLRVCVLELEAGEKVIGEPHVGDSVRWSIAPATSGPPNLLTSMIVVKPKQSGLDTNLLVTTDRRTYYVRLVSKPEEYVPRVAFSYPEDDAFKWRSLLAQQEQRRKQELENSRIDSIESLENLYFDYRIRGRDENIRPVRVVDDGKKTFIQMPSGTAVREVPVLVVLGSEGKAEMVNYRVKSDLYVVDRLFERGALLLGAGKKQHRTDIIRGTYHPRNAKAEAAALSRGIDEVAGADKN